MPAPCALPDFLSHYYDRNSGPFRSLSDLSLQEAAVIQARIRQAGAQFASRCPADYLVNRQFIQKGGCPLRQRPHYFVLGSCAWLLTWYKCGCELRLPVARFQMQAVSFTYGDSFPALRYQDGRPHRGQVYTWDELPELLERYGLPQEWNPNGELGPERYIEAQVWDDAPLIEFLSVPRPSAEAKEAEGGKFFCGGKMIESIEKVNLAQKFSMFQEPWSPRIVAEMNDFFVKLARLHGEFVWHHHDAEDELFLVIQGELTIQLRDRDLHLSPGELVVIPKGIEHKPVANDEVQVLLLEPKSTLNTGNLQNERTVEAQWV